MANTPIVDYIRTHPQLFRYMDFLQEIFMIADRRTVDDLKSDGSGQYTTTYTGKLNPHAGSLFLGPENVMYSLVSAERIDDHTGDVPVFQLTLTKTDIVISVPEHNPLVTPQTPMTIYPNDLPNYTDDTATQTTVGRFIANAFIIVPVFGSSVPYHNKELTRGQYEKYLGDALLSKRVTVQQIKTVGIDHMFFLLSRPELFSPNITVKALTTDPNIPKVRAQLIAERKERLDAGDPTAMAEVETPLIQMDKDRLKDDPSAHYYLGKDDFSNKRKKLMVTTGSIEVFGKPGQFTFVDTPLADGWTYKGTPVLINESRHGSQSRAIETANGGEDAKYIGRVFAALYITANDCGTKRGVTEPIRPDTFEDHLNRYVIDGKDLVILNEDTKSKYMGKDVVLRSPFYCLAERGFCAKCISHTFEALGQEALLTAVRNISAQFTTDSLKKSHTSGVSTFRVTNLNDFLI